MMDIHRHDGPDPLPAGKARCARCKVVDDARTRLGIHYNKYPDGSGLWTWLHYGECMESWYRRYWQRLREVAPEVADSWEQREEQDRNLRVAGRRKRGMAA